MCLKSLLKIQIGLIFLAFPFLNSCLHECRDFISREFTEEEKKFIPYNPNDSMIFFNLNDNKEYRFDCVEKYFNLRDSGYIEDYYCEEGGYFAVNSRLEASLISDLVLEDNENLKIHLSLGTNDTPKSRFRISLGLPIDVETDVDFNPSTLRLDTNEIIDNPDQTFYLDDIKIHDVVYKNVYGIIPRKYEDYEPRLDTIYYNSSQGILKIVSAMYDFNLVLARR